MPGCAVRSQGTPSFQGHQVIFMQTKILEPHTETQVAPIRKMDKKKVDEFSSRYWDLKNITSMHGTVIQEYKMFTQGVGWIQTEGNFDPYNV